jgi:hypothetical protein
MSPELSREWQRARADSFEPAFTPNLVQSEIGVAATMVQ